VRVVKTVAVVALLALAGCGSDTYQVVATEKGVIKWNAKTGEAWTLIYTESPPRWLPIEEPRPR
jgi:hypothetical protein